MPRSWIERIREKVRLRQYDMTVHALEEMAEDRLDIVDMDTLFLPAAWCVSGGMIQEGTST